MINVEEFTLIGLGQKSSVKFKILLLSSSLTLAYIKMTHIKLIIHNFVDYTYMNLSYLFNLPLMMLDIFSYNGLNH